MKWFKHENTFNSPKIEVLIEKYGNEGYGIYFRLLELIASHIDPDNQNEWGYLPDEYDNDYLAKKLQISVEKLDEIVMECIRLKLFEKVNETVYCPKILQRCDDYTSRLVKQTTESVRSNSEESPTKNKKKNKKENKNIKISTNVDTAVAVVEKKSFGNQDINQLGAYFLSVFDIPKEDCTQAESRRYWNLLLKESKNGVDGVKWLIDLALSDEFYKNNITSSKDLYYKRIKLMARKRGSVPVIASMPKEL